MSILIVDGNGNTLAAFTFNIPISGGKVVKIDQAYGRTFMESLRKIPRPCMEVNASYPSLGKRKFPFNTLKASIMNISDHIPAKVEQDVSDVKKFFVAPSPAILPDDGVLNYMAIESVYDLTSAPDRSVLLFSASSIDVLKCVAENTLLFGVELFYLSGIPGAEYTAQFDEAAWNLTRTAYAPLLSDLRHEVDMSEQLAAQNETVHDREKSHYTRENGTVKALTGIDVATVGSQASDHEADFGDTTTEFIL